MSTPSISQLQRAIEISEQIQTLEAELKSLLAGAWVSSGKSAVAAREPRKKRGMSAEGRAKIAAAQKARWAKAKGENSSSDVEAPAKAASAGKKKKRKLSPEARARIVAAVKARWAKQKRTK